MLPDVPGKIILEMYTHTLKKNIPHHTAICQYNFYNYYDLFNIPVDEDDRDIKTAFRVKNIRLKISIVKKV